MVNPAQKPASDTPDAARVQSLSAAQASPSGTITTGIPNGAKTILNDADISRILDRISHQILEKTRGGIDTVLLGIPTRGIALATRLADRLHRFSDVNIPSGTLDVTLYRDDLKNNAYRPLGPTQLPTEGIDGKRVILIDDVLYSGRTIRAALNALYDLGRPESVQLAVLVDRGHRDLPIRADYVGKNIPTSRDEKISVRLAEYDGLDAVFLSGGDK